MATGIAGVRLGDADHCNRAGAVAQLTGAEQTVTCIVAAPAPDRAACDERTGVVIAGGDVSDVGAAGASPMQLRLGVDLARQGSSRGC